MRAREMVFEDPFRQGRQLVSHQPEALARTHQNRSVDQDAREGNGLRRPVPSREAIGITPTRSVSEDPPESKRWPGCARGKWSSKTRSAKGGNWYHTNPKR